MRAGDVQVAEQAGELEHEGAEGQGRLVRRLVRLDGTLLKMLLTAGNVIHAQVDAGLPDDAQLVTVTYDYRDDRYYLVFESALWEDFGPEGRRLDEQPVTWRMLHEDGG